MSKEEKKNLDESQKFEKNIYSSSITNMKYVGYYGKAGLLMLCRCFLTPKSYVFEVFSGAVSKRKLSRAN